MGFLTEEEARTILSPIEALLTGCFSSAFSKWQVEVAKLFPSVTTRGKRNIIHELIVERVREAFSDHSGAKVVHTDDNRVLLLYGGLTIRFKYLDPKLRSASYPTPLAKLVETPVFLPSIPVGHRVTVGYTLQALETELGGVYAVYYLRRRQPTWSFQFGREDRQTQLFPRRLIAPSSPPTEPQRRIRPKQHKVAGKVVPIRSSKRKR